MHFILWPNQCFRHLSAPFVRSIRTDGQRESRHLLSFSLAIFAFKIAVNITKPKERDLNSYGWFSIIKNFVTFLRSVFLSKPWMMETLGAFSTQLSQL